MRLTFLGAASGIPVGNRNGSSLLVEHDGCIVLFDCGEGAVQTLLRLHVDLHTIGRIYLSHTHPDHVAGLPMLLQGMRLSGRTHPLYIVTDPRNHVWMLEMLRGMFLIPSRWSFPMNVVDYSFDAFGSGNTLHVTSSENSHLDGAHSLAEEQGVTPACYSFHLRTQSHNVFLSSDIGSVTDIEPHLNTADTAVVEATHIQIDHLLDLVRRTPAVRFVFTHIPPELDARFPETTAQAADEFGGRAVFASDGFVIQLDEESAVG